MHNTLLKIYKNIKSNEESNDLYYALSIMCFENTTKLIDELLLSHESKVYHEMMVDIMNHLNESQLDSFVEKLNDVLNEYKEINKYEYSIISDMFYFILSLKKMRRSYSKVLQKVVSIEDKKDRIKAYEEIYIGRVIAYSKSQVELYNGIFPLLNDKKTRKDIVNYFKNIMKDNEDRKKMNNIINAETNNIYSTDRFMLNLTRLLLYSYFQGRRIRDISIDTLYSKHLNIDLGQDVSNDTSITYFDESLYLILKLFDVFFIPNILKINQLKLEINDIESKISYFQEKKDQLLSTAEMSNHYLLENINKFLLDLNKSKTDKSNDIDRITTLLEYNLLISLSDVISGFFLKMIEENKSTELLVQSYNIFLKYILSSGIFVVLPNIVNISLVLISLPDISNHNKMPVIENLTKYILIHSHSNIEFIKSHIEKHIVQIIYTVLNYYVTLQSDSVEIYNRLKIRYDSIFMLFKLFEKYDGGIQYFVRNSFIQKDLYIKFINGILNDIDYIYDECLTMIRRINELEKKSELSRSDMSEMLHYEKTLSIMLVYLDVNLMFVGIIMNKIIDIFSSPEIEEKFICSFNNYLKIMVGENRSELKIKNSKRYGYKPINILIRLGYIFTKCIYSDSLKKAIVYEEHSYNIKYFKEISKIFKKKIKKKDIMEKEGLQIFSVLTWNLIDDIEHLIDKLNDIELEYKLEKSFDIEVPDKFCDPLMLTLIDEPIELPSEEISDNMTYIIMDKLVIKKWLLENNSNPYNRKHLTMEILEKYNKKENVVKRVDKFRTELNEWKRENYK